MGCLVFTAREPIEMAMRWLLILLPWLEFFTLLRLGTSIGALNTVFYVFATLVVGIAILRWQGMEMLSKLQAAQQDPSQMQRQVFGSQLSLALSGVLLMVPGLLTDTAGAGLFVFSLLRQWTTPASGGSDLYKNSAVQRETGVTQPPPSRDGSAQGGPSVIDGEYSRIDDDDR